MEIAPLPMPLYRSEVDKFREPATLPFPSAKSFLLVFNNWYLKLNFFYIAGNSNSATARFNEQNYPKPASQLFQILSSTGRTKQIIQIINMIRLLNKPSLTSNYLQYSIINKIETEQTKTNICVSYLQNVISDRSNRLILLTFIFTSAVQLLLVSKYGPNRFFYQFVEQNFRILFHGP